MTIAHPGVRPMIMRHGLLLIALALVFAVSQITCRGTQEPILALLARLEAEAEKRDSSAIVSHLSPDFRCSAGPSREDAAALLRRYFSAYETVRLEVYEVVVEREESSAVLRFRVDFSGKAPRLGGLSALLPPSAMYRFELRLVPNGDEWMINEARWEDLGPSSAPILGTDDSDGA
jgi:hypothetical protein